MNPNSDDMKDDYSELFATQTPVRGKYYERAMRAKHLVPQKRMSMLRFVVY
jgi:hypothetical protein